MNKQIVAAVKALRALSYADFYFAVSLARPARLTIKKRGRKKPGPKPGTKRAAAPAPAAAKPSRRISRVEAAAPQPTA